MITRAQSIVGFRPEGRPTEDFYPTSREAVYGLLDKEIMFQPVWECACGTGSISTILEHEGMKVISTDLNDYGYGTSGIDFLKTTKLLAPNIVTNPPFKLAEKFIVHAFDLRADGIYLLLKLAFLEGQARKKLFETYPPVRIHVFSKRIQMTRNGEEPRGSGMIAFAWFVWHKGNQSYPTVDWI